MPVRTLSADPLALDPRLAGHPLPSPGRRLLAFVIDGLLLAVPTVGAAVAAAGLSLYLADPASFDALRHVSRLSDPDEAVARQEARHLLPLLVRLRAPGLPASVTAAYEDGDVERAAVLLRRLDIVLALKFLPESEDEAVAAASVRVPIERLIPTPIRATALLFVPGAYFVLLSRSRHGATIGKRLLGLRVARLDGQRLGWFDAIERFSGYAQIPASAFLGLVDLWRDPNRRLAHDRSAHTVVLFVSPPAAPATSSVKPAGLAANAGDDATV